MRLDGLQTGYGGVDSEALHDQEKRVGEADFRLPVLCMLKIGDADIYPDQDLIRCSGAKTALTPRSMDVLVYLAERPGVTVSAEELLQALWANHYIADNAVHKAVSEIRHAFGDDHQNPRYIRTVRKRGYRLIAPVSGAPTSALPKPNRRNTLPKSVAVLPLNNFMNDPGQDFFVEGMHEALITNLARIGALHVISRTSVMGYKDTTKSSPEIGDELNVEVLVEGSVFRTGDRVRITVQLIEVATDRHLWAESYERELRDVLALQKDVARAIAKEIRIRVTPAEKAQLASERAVDPQAYEAYLKGVYHAESYQRVAGPRLGSGQLGATLAPLRRSIEYHQEAVRRDPGWALAHAGLARAYHWLAGEPGVDNDVELWRKSKAAVLKALQLDEGLAQAHGSLGYVLHNYDWDWEGAERAYRRAVELDPSVTWGYALFLLSAAQHDEAIANFIRAEARNPNSLMVKTQLGFAYICAGQLDEAVEQLQKVIELDAEFTYAHLTLGYAYLGKSMYEEAVTETETAAELSDDAALQMLPHLGYAYARAGRTAEAQAILRELEATEHGFLPGLPELYVALGQKDKARAQFEAAFEKRDRRVLILRCMPAYDRLRDDPRFQALLRRIDFPS